MEKKETKINYESREVPSGPGAQQITNMGLKSQKGGSEMVSKMPTENVVPDGCCGSKKGFSSK